jgi:hypothetical protein
MFAGGVIEVMNTEAEAVSECSDAPITETERQLAPTILVTSCWKTDATSARIVLPPNEGAIRGETLRQLALFFTEYFVDRALTAQAPFDGVEWQAYLSGVDRSRKALEVAFFEDLQSSRPDAHTKIIAAVAQDRRANFVYAEAIDSYYCSSTGEKSTRSLFRQEFPETWKVFTDKTDEYSPVRLFGE